MKNLKIIIIFVLLLLGITSCSSLEMETAGASKNLNQKY